MSVMISNCGNCIYRQGDGYCMWDPSAKTLSEDCCSWWEAKTPDASKIKTTTTDDDLFTKLTARVSKLEDKVGKLEDSVKVLDAREKSKQEKPYKWKLKVEDIDKITPDGKCKESGKRLIDMNKCPIKNWDDIGEICRPLHCEFFDKGTKQEKWIVHRTLRIKNKETYVGTRTNTDYDDVKCGYTTVFQIEYAKKFTEEEAISIRDELNKKRIGKRYLWLISQVEEK